MVDLVDVIRWRRWLTSRRGGRCWQGWAEDHPSLVGWTPGRLERPRWSPATDRLQHDLVALAQGGQGDAAITLLVQLRPGLFRLVGDLELRRGETRSDACDEVRGVFNETLYRHPLGRRPSRIAANLVLDTRQRLNRTLPDGMAGLGSAPPPHEPAAPVPGPDAITPAAVLRLAIDHLPGSPQYRAVTAEAAYRAWILEQPQAIIADQLGLEAGAVARRLYRLRRLVRQEWQGQEEEEEEEKEDDDERP